MKNNVIKRNPVILKAMLDAKVIGQDLAKKQLCMAIDTQINKLNNPEYRSTKKNLLLIGKKGSGKSEVIKAISEIKLPVPVIIVDAFALMREKNIAKYLFEETLYEANLDQNLEEHAIVIIDNLDYALTGDPENYDIDKEGMQFITKLEGFLRGTTQIKFNFNKPTEKTDENQKEEQPEKVFKFDKMMFMVVANLPLLPLLVKYRIGSNKIGFLRNPQTSDLYSKVQTEDLLKFGFPSSFIGEFDSIIKFKTRTNEEIINIIAKSDLITDFRARLKENGKDLIVTEEALKELAEYAMENKLGLWSIKNMIESKLSLVEFDAIYDENKEVIVKTFLDV